MNSIRITIRPLASLTVSRSFSRAVLSRGYATKAAEEEEYKVQVVDEGTAETNPDLAWLSSDKLNSMRRAIIEKHEKKVRLYDQVSKYLPYLVAFPEEADPMNPSKATLDKISGGPMPEIHLPPLPGSGAKL
eukprot:TRINITY_DN376_c0_g1_i1.p1 TRINITY_DN376_c0_g1~~TRINITY_DN376_c0_g1_i1.p1  ORF type:complete len:132 (+),score=31.64 TRINITY_DN376_c0_g1_i1:98-493(+)